MATIIIAGSKGLIGTKITKYFQKNHEVFELDITLGHDLTDEAFVEEWFKEHKGDYLINLFALNHHIDESAGKRTLFNAPLDEFRKYMEVNLTALFSVCREFARNNKKGAIVNFTSTYGLVSPRPDMYEGDEKDIGYSVSKGGVVMLTRHLATHLAPDIRVNCVAPGGVENDQGKDFQERYAANTPMARMMRPDELIGILDYLCSDASSYATGAVFTIDGGWTVQ